jgi:GTP pyrophosphokinase
MESAHVCPPAIAAEIALARAAVEEIAAATNLAQAVEVAELVAAITEDAILARAVVARAATGAAGMTPEALARHVGPETASLAFEIARFDEIGAGQRWSAEQSLAPAQAEALRKMLLAVVSDPRLVLARIADHLVRLRAAKNASTEERERLAQEGRAIFAPLANRLGVWQLKWEIEDLAFRYLEAADYKHIAAALNERRADRERYIGELCALLRAELARAGVAAEVYGRPKHIFSIYRKMHRKNLAFEQLFDVRAVRIVVASIPECYAALGVVHGHWSYIPGEFDDYIATPKDNDYRSIHTAVIGPEGKAVEVQIRTREMHEQAELGVAAHWRYKEGGARDARDERRIEWVRRLLEPGEAADGDRDFLERVRSELFEDRVYALTPKGEVVDLPRGATPLDFAYHVHTDLGHRCRGAKVDGRIVPLTHALSNGEVVEIITGKLPNPSRDWLVPEQGFLASPRSRAKVRAWFRKQIETDDRAADREEVAERELAPQRPRPIATRGGPPVAIEGVGNLPVTMARCCAPVRPQPIAGYLTLGRGVTIHRAGCPSLARMTAARPERLLSVEWTGTPEGVFPVEITTRAYDRRGLVRDISDIIAAEKIGIEAMTTTTDREEGTATVVMRIGVHDLEQLSRALRRITRVPSVFVTRRTR